MSAAEAPLVGLLVGSDSDREPMQPALDELEARGIPYEFEVRSAHRNPDAVAESRHRRVGAHAAGVWARVLLADPLEVLRGSESDGVLAIREREQRDLLTLEQLFDQEVAAELGGGAQAGVELVLRLADEDALSCCEAVDLDHAGRARDGDALRGRHARRLEHVLGERLRAFDPCRRLRRTEGGDPAATERVHEPDHERSLRPHHHQVDADLAAEREQALAVLGANRVALPQARDPRVARRRVQLVELGARGKLPGERVLAAARPDDQHLHGGECTAGVGAAPLASPGTRFARPPPQGDRIAGRLACL